MLDNLFLDLSNPIFQLIIAVLLGAFIGIRREAELQKKKIVGFRGLRTTALVSALGAISTFFKEFSYLPVIFFMFLGVWIVIAYQSGVKKGKIGMTSEVSLILIFWSGVFIGYQNFILGIILGLVVAISDAYKDKMHNLVARLQLKEWSGALQMIIISLVFLPFLPKKAIDQWGVFVPYDVWMLVVLVTGIGFLGYFLNKIFNKGKFKGIYLTSVLGSIISSTAVTVQLSQKVKKDSSVLKYLPVSILLAIAVMLIRDILIVLAASDKIAWTIIKTPVVMLLTALFLLIIYWFVNTGKKGTEQEITVNEKSPFEIIPALKFAFIFTLILFLIHFVKDWLGNQAVYVTTFLVSLIDTETIILPAIENQKNGHFDLVMVGNIISIAIVVNTLIKLFYIRVFAGKKSFWILFWPIVVVSLAGLLVIFL